MEPKSVELVFGLLGMLGMFGALIRFGAMDSITGQRPMIGRLLSGLHLTMSILAALGMFLFAWFWAVSNWGWLLGLAFGWVPAIIVALMIAYAWWIACYGLFFLFHFAK